MMTSKVGMSKSEHCCFSLFLRPTYVVHDTLYHGTLTHTSPWSPESTDPEFDDFQRNFAVLESAAEKFLKDTKAFTEAVNSMCPIRVLFHDLTSLTCDRPFMFGQHSSRPGVVSPNTSLSSSIPLLPSMTSSASSPKLRTRSRTLTPTTPHWRSCGHPSAPSSS